VADAGYALFFEKQVIQIMIPNNSILSILFLDSFNIAFQSLYNFFRLL